MRPDIAICVPDIVICVPDIVICVPDIVICVPDIVLCVPDIVICVPDFNGEPSYLLSKATRRRNRDKNTKKLFHSHSTIFTTLQFKIMVPFPCSDLFFV